MEPADKLEKIIGLDFKDKTLLLTALTHPSFINENAIDRDSYQRLEFFGDAILEFIASEYLYRRFHDIREGRLTEIRAALVRTESLAKCARKMELGKFLFLSKGEELNNGRDNQNILADALEAMIGAIYLDQGMDSSTAFFNRYIREELDTIVANKLYIDPKTRLQEIIQGQYKITPEYRLIQETISENSLSFEIGVYFNNKLIGKGKGKNKKLAEQEAAINALGKLDRL